MASLAGKLSGDLMMPGTGAGAYAIHESDQRIFIGIFLQGIEGDKISKVYITLPISFRLE